MRTLTVASTLDAPSDAVWRRVTTPEGINDELMPVMKMTVPAPLRGISIEQIEPGTRLGRSYFLLLGLIPFEYDDITIAELEQGRRFVERSTMMSMRAWQHQRTVVPQPGGCEVRDEVSFRLRRPAAWIPGWPALVAAVLGALFRHRHQRLAAHFSAQPAQPVPGSAL